MTEEELNDPKNAEHLAFITECEYGGMTHYEIAEELKEKGNLVLKGGKIRDGAVSCLFTTLAPKN